MSEQLLDIVSAYGILVAGLILITLFRKIKAIKDMHLKGSLTGITGIWAAVFSVAIAWKAVDRNVITSDHIGFAPMIIATALVLAAGLYFSIKGIREA